MKNLLILLFGRFTSMLGNSMLKLALPILILERTSSVAVMGKFTAITIFPGVLFLPLIGLIIENRNKKYCMVITDLIQFILFGVLWYINRCSEISLITLSIFILISKIIGEFFNISSASIFPSIIPSELFSKGNSLKGILDNMAEILAPILGIFIYYKYGIGIIFLINAVTFIISAFLECFMIYQKINNTCVNGEKKVDFIKYKEVGKFVLSDKLLLNFFIFIMVANFIAGPIGMTLLPYITLHIMNFTEFQYSIFNMSIILGMLLGSSLIFLKNKELEIKTLITVHSFLFIFMGLGALSEVIQYSVKFYFYLYIILYFGVGFLNSLINIPIGTNLQKRIPPEMQGRFFAILSFFGGILIPLGNYIFGNLCEIIPPQWLLIIDGLIIMIIVKFLRFSYTSSQKRIHSNSVCY